MASSSRGERGDFSFGPAPVFRWKRDTPKPGLRSYKLDAQFVFSDSCSFLMRQTALRFSSGLLIDQEDGRFDFSHRGQHQVSAMSVYNRGTHFLPKNRPIRIFADDCHGHIDCHPGTPTRHGILWCFLFVGSGAYGGRKARFRVNHEGSSERHYVNILRPLQSDSPEHCQVFHRMLYRLRD